MIPPVFKKSITAPEEEGTSRRLVAAILCACVTLAIYLLLPGVLEQITSTEPSNAAALFPWVKPVTRQLLNTRQNESTDLRSAVQFCACIAGLFAAYLFMIRLAARDPSRRMQRFLFWAAATVLAVNLLAPVMLSTDIYAYTFYGRMVALRHMDAYAETIPDALAADKYLALFGRGYIGSVYGPLWTLISSFLVRLGGDNPAMIVLIFRAVSSAAVLAGAGLISAILRRISPARAAQGMVFFLWNPLVIIESSMSGHNDTVMIFFLLLGIWCHASGRRTGAVVSLLLSALVKFVTAPLVPLYLLMVLRQPASWGARARFLARSLACCAAVTWALFFMVHAKPGMPASRFANSPEFYMNNFHELIFKGIRCVLGEDASSVNVPIEFQSWWFAAAQSGKLYTAPARNAGSLGEVEKGRNLLVLAPFVCDWATVYDPVLKRKGFVSDDLIEEIDNDSGGLDSDPYLAHLEECPLDWPTVNTANLWIRRVCNALFALFGLIAAWRAADFDRFLTWSAAVLLATYFLIMTQLWPWYVIWALALGALKPLNRPARLALFLSAGVLTLYVTIGFAPGDLEWLYRIRSIPAVILPLMLFLAVVFFGRPGRPRADASRQ